MSSIDTEDLIVRLSNGLDPADRAAFRNAAETTLATSRECSGEGSAYRVIAAVALVLPSADGHGWGESGYTKRYKERG